MYPLARFKSQHIGVTCSGNIDVNPFKPTTSLAASIPTSKNNHIRNLSGGPEKTRAEEHPASALRAAVKSPKSVKRARRSYGDVRK